MMAGEFCIPGVFFCFFLVKKSPVFVKSIWLTVLHAGAVCVVVVVQRLYAMDTNIHIYPMTLPISPHFILEGLC